MDMFGGKKILITGGTGSLGTALTAKLLEYNPQVIRVLDIDESSLFSMENQFSGHDNLRFLVGDVRNKDRLLFAMEDIDIVFHLAALKHVMLSEYNPFEAVQTNVIGTQNVIEAAISHNVERVIYTSSDKAANPNNTMGATKLLAEKLVSSANYYRGKRRTIFSSVRFGNVLGSRGSVIDLWQEQKEKGDDITVTDPNMTRFIMSKDSAINLLLKCAELSIGGEIFILKMPVIKVGDLADAFIENSGKKMKKKIIGKKPGETNFEELMTEHEAVRSLETEDLFIIPSEVVSFKGEKTPTYPNAKNADTQTYDSDSENPLTKNQIIKILLDN